MADSSPKAIRYLAVAASLFAFPGLGHGLAGYPLRGAGWVGGFALSGALVAAAGAFHPGALLLFPVAFTVAYLLAAVDAWRKSRTAGNHEWWGWLILVAALGLCFTAFPIGLALAIRATSLASFKIPSGGMCPTLVVGDQLFVDKTAYRFSPPARGDVIVYDTGTSSSDDLIFRVVGVGGDDVAVASDGSIALAGVLAEHQATSEFGCGGGATLQEENLGTRHQFASGPGPAVNPGRVAHVPAGYVFVVGDHRTSAADSRMSGPVPVSSVLGKARWLWLRSGQLTWQSIQ